MIRLFDILFPPRLDEITLREISPDEFLMLVALQLVPCTRPGTVALLPFSNAFVRSAIHEAKYHGNKQAVRLLALALNEYLSDADEQAHTIVIVPIPLGTARRKERGFNQAEEIARHALNEIIADESRAFTLEPNLLTRTRETVSQVSLARGAREENMRGAFKARHSINPSYTYLVLDDVLTTGATLQATIDALKEAGALNIIPLALAH